MRGSTLLRVASVLLIIFSAISLLFLLLSGVIATVGTLVGADGSGALLALLVFPALSVVFELVTGIIGLINSRRPDRAMGCIVLGIILLVISLVGTILNLIRSFDASSLISGVIGLILPVLYLIGAFQLKRMQVQP